MAATTLAKYGKGDISCTREACVQIFTGQADGLNPRSLEILQGMGMAPELLQETNELGEICFCNPGKDSGMLERTGRLPDTIPGISRFRQSVIHQGRIERLFLGKMAAWSKDAQGRQRIVVERGVTPDLLILPSLEANPLSNDPDDRITVRLRHLSAAEAKPAQNALGFKLVGESADFFWGVVDGIPVTDFPDIRMRCAIHSAESGSLRIIPRENQLVRLYIQIPQPANGQRPNRADVTPEKLIDAAKKIMEPYTVDFPHRLADQWVWGDRNFCAGDAVHTHSPKAGQGMNTSMADTFNLTRKLAHVLQRKAVPQILRTYHTERSEVADELIRFDHKFSRVFSGKPQKDIFDETGVSLAEFKDAFEKGNNFSSGTSVDYPHSGIVSKPAEGSASALAPNLPVGPRFKSHQVVCLSNALPYAIGDLLSVDGRWRVVVFAGDVRIPALRARVDGLAAFLGESADSPVVKYTPAGADVDSIVECLTILGCPRVDVEQETFGEVLRPRKGLHGCRDYLKIFADGESCHQGHGRAYEKYGIDPKVGCVVVVRPDQYVALVTDVGDHEGIARFFDGFMLSCDTML
ncbi:thioredoxin-like protein [Amylostereum chailletii]|nr:thioredoxin-like protein [Amylostereum chailletii]